MRTYSVESFMFIERTMDKTQYMYTYLLFLKNDLRKCERQKQGRMSRNGRFIIILITNSHNLLSPSQDPDINPVEHFLNKVKICSDHLRLLGTKES
jgi:hypothetical protein